VVDLAVALPVDDSPSLTLCRPARGPREATALVAVLDGFDVTEVPGKSGRAASGSYSRGHLLLGGSVGQNDPLDDGGQLVRLLRLLHKLEVLGRDLRTAHAAVLVLGSPGHPVLTVRILLSWLLS